MARAERNKKRRGSTVSINWGEAELKNFVTREGTYTFKVTKAEEGDGDNIIVTAEVTGGSPASQIGKSVKSYFNTQPQSLWKLAQFLEAVGQEVPEDEEDLDLDELIDLEFAGEVGEHKFDGKTYMRIQQFLTTDDVENGDDKPAPKKGKAPAEEEDDEEEEKEVKRGRGRPKGSKNKETKAPKKGKDLPKVSESEVDDMSEDDLESLVDKYGLNVDLDEKKTLRGKGALVIDALEEKGLLES